MRLYLPLELLAKIGLQNQSKTASRILDDLKVLTASVQNEFFSAVHLELVDENDPQFQEAKAISTKPSVNPEALPFWKPGMVRLFVSHNAAPNGGRRTRYGKNIHQTMVSADRENYRASSNAGRKGPSE